MSTTVSVGSMEVTSVGTGESAQEMIDVLIPKEEPPKTRIIEENGEPVPEKDAEAEGLSRAASELGKKGGEAAARARAKEKADEPSEEEDLAEAEAAEKEGKLGKPRHDPRARMLEKAREAKALKAEVAAERAKREAAERKAAELERSRQEPPRATERVLNERDDDPKPILNDQPYEEWVEKTAEWHARKEFKRLEVEAAARAREAARATKAEAFRRSVDERVPLFVERVAGVPRTDPTQAAKFQAAMAGMSPAVTNLKTSFQLGPDEEIGSANLVADALYRSDKALDLMRHFTEHPDVLQRLVTLEVPTDVVWEMASIAAGLGAANAGASPEPEVSKAKPSGRPVPVSPHADSTGLDEDAPLSAFVSDWEKREQVSRR